MKNVCFVIMGNIYIAPYITLYTERMKCQYTVIYWDRENKQEDLGNNTYYRFEKSLDGRGTINKIRGFIEFRKFATGILRRNEFDVIILLQTWCAIIFSKVLREKYKGKYVVDVRDYTYEHNKIISRIEERTFADSLGVVVSSEGYKEFLPKRDYYIAHNIRQLDVNTINAIKQRDKKREVLHIAFIGYVNYMERNKKLILALKADERFRISFIGTHALDLKNFCTDNNAKNVNLIGTFNADQILDFYKDVDLVNNLYGNHTPTLDYALSNKLYFSAELRIPILVCPETYMEKVACEYEIGYTVDLDVPGFADGLYDFYRNIKWEDFDKSCERFLDKAKQDQQELVNYLDSILN